VNTHNGQPKPNLRRKRKVLYCGLEGLLEIVGLEVMAEAIRAGRGLHIRRSGGKEFQIVGLHHLNYGHQTKCEHTGWTAD